MKRSEDIIHLYWSDLSDKGKGKILAAMNADHPQEHARVREMIDQYGISLDLENLEEEIYKKTKSRK